jgi:serine/threonine-protein kinase
MGGVGPGEVLNSRYELIERIGGGSMGEVWRGRDLVLGRTVAVKIVLPGLLDAPTFLERFAAEARVMAMIDHPGVVGVFDYGYTPGERGAPGTAFLVMEFIDGESLDRVLSRLGPLEPGFVLETIASLLDALASVHRQGVVHRDIKPGNVMLRQEGVVLADFGIARSPESLGLTAADKLMGTVPYLAPELFRSEAPATPAADVYAVGILAFELLDGLPPFHASTTAAVMFKHVNEPPPPLPEYVPEGLVQLLDRALAKNADDRWPDAAAMAVAVRAVLAGGSVPEWEPVVAEPVRRRSAGADGSGDGVGTGSGSGSGAGSQSGSGSGAGDRDREWGGAGRHGSEATRYGSAGVERGTARSEGASQGQSRGGNGTGGRSGGTGGTGGTHAIGGGRHGTGDSNPGPSWREDTGDSARHAAGRRHSTEIELHASAVTRRLDGSGTVESDRPNRRRTLVPVAGGVAAVALAVVIVAASQGSGTSGKSGKDAVGQAAVPSVSTGGQSPSVYSPTPSSAASTTRQHNSGTTPSHTRSGGTAVPNTPSGSSASSGTMTATSGLSSTSLGGSSSSSATVSTPPPTSPASSSASPSAQTTAVPDVTGDGLSITYTQASSTLSQSGFNAVPGTKSGSTNCHVSHQNPAPNALAVVGSNVTLDQVCT